MSFVTLLNAKAHLRILHSDEDVYIQNLVDVAINQAEEITSRNFLETENEFYLSKYEGVFELPKSPLIAIDAIEYIPFGETSYSLISSSLYDVDDSCEPAKIRLLENICVADVFKAIKVTYRAGYADAELVPKPLKQWILLRVATLYENREDVLPVSMKEVQNDYNEYLISKYKVGRL